MVVIIIKMKRIILIFGLTIFCLTSFSQQQGTFKDPRDGKIYKTVKIGNQTWFAENLAYLPQVCPYWEGCGFYVYEYVDDNDPKNAMKTEMFKTYGTLYSWENAKKVCPSGWHLPSDNEWKQLEIFLGMSEREADKEGVRGKDSNIGSLLKDTILWLKPNKKEPNKIEKNLTGFNVLPSGRRCSDDRKLFIYLSTTGEFWTSSTKGQYIWTRKFNSYNGGIDRSVDDHSSGISVRCIKD